MRQCPVCQAWCFDDMPICFGCMHRFDNDEEPHGLPNDTEVFLGAQSVLSVEAGRAQDAGEGAALQPQEQRHLEGMPLVEVFEGSPASEEANAFEMHGQSQPSARIAMRPRTYPAKSPRRRGYPTGSHEESFTVIPGQQVSLPKPQDGFQIVVSLLPLADQSVAASAVREYD